MVGKLREENRTVQKYKQTTREQEMVIEKLEVLLETALLDKQKLQKQLDEHAVCSVRPESAGYGFCARFSILVAAVVKMPPPVRNSGH